MDSDGPEPLATVGQLSSPRFASFFEPPLCFTRRSFVRDSTTKARSAGASIIRTWIFFDRAVHSNPLLHACAWSRGPRSLTALRRIAVERDFSNGFPGFRSSDGAAIETGIISGVLGSNARKRFPYLSALGRCARDAICSRQDENSVEIEITSVRVGSLLHAIRYALRLRFAEINYMFAYEIKFSSRCYRFDVIFCICDIWVSEQINAVSIPFVFLRCAPRENVVINIYARRRVVL